MLDYLGNLNRLIKAVVAVLVAVSAIVGVILELVRRLCECPDAE